MPEDERFEIRPVRAEDVATLLELIRGLADYEKLSGQVVASEEDLREALFSDERGPEAVIAWADGEAIGFALFFQTFSTFLGRPGLYLEDLFVRPAWRGHGVGKRLFEHVARVAAERACGRLEWSVLDWNERAISFYRSLGAEPVEGWTVYRLTGAALARLGSK